MISYTFRCFPNQEQKEIIEKQLELCRSLYNYLLETIQKPRGDFSKWNKYNSQHEITKIKKEKTEYKQVNSKVLQMVNYVLWDNIKALSKLKQKGGFFNGDRRTPFFYLFL